MFISENMLFLLKPKNYLTCSKLTYATSKKSSNDFKYCMDLVKTSDFNAYLTTILSPPTIIRSAFALTAFNIELMSIGRSRGDPRIPEIKLHFWKEQLDKIFKHTDDQRVSTLAEPISNELSVMVRNYGLNRTWFNRLIDGRRQFLKVNQIESLDALEKYADSQIASVYYILLNCMSLGNSVDCDHVASHLSKAILISTLVRNMLKPNSQSAYYIPFDLLLKHKISQQDLINVSERQLRPKSQNIKELAFEMSTRAHQHLNSARDLAEKVPVEARPLFTSAIACDVYLKQLQRFDFDLMNPKLNSDRRVTFIVKLMLAKMKKSF